MKEKLLFKFIIVVILSSIIFYGCGSGGEKTDASSEKETAKKETAKSKKQINPRDYSPEEYAIIKRDAMIKFGEKQQKIAEQLNAGEITESEVQSKMRKYTKESKIATGGKMPTGLPGWAKKIGLTEPKGMEVDEVYSSETSVDNPHEGFNSIHLIYNGDYDVAMSEAKKIAGKANMPIDKMWEKAMELHSDLKGMTYRSTKSEDNDYETTIVVNEDGVLVIHSSNYKQMMDVLDKYTKEK